MSKKKSAIKFLSKRLGELKKNKLKTHKYKRTDRGGTRVEEVSFKKGSVQKAFITSEASRATDKQRVTDVYVDEDVRNRGLSTRLMEILMKGSKKPTLSGTTISDAQKKVRDKFPTRSATYGKTTKGVQRYAVYTPTKNKKVLNKSTGKVRFIRKNGRIIPIRNKRKK